ncbi:putative aarF domain-containing protein kinase 1 [Parachaetomium inaequale]|uniref:AarF domain-containing protein kinase 1 n=1 Tax=Parachaetomium inaequale TaxID=2588326 RepID=A0AAN6SUQ0_9PEZI|nr:putative aarF domain-containing protein kinase 1 [Parachaetomium inaequale]
MWRLGMAGAQHPPLPAFRPRAIRMTEIPSMRRCAMRTPPPPPRTAAPLLLPSPHRPFSSTARLSSGGGGPFEPLRPPSPRSLGLPRAARTFTRTRRWTRRLLLLSTLLGTAYLLDRQLYASGIARSLRTFSMGLLVAADYKLNFRPEPLPLVGSEGGIPELHRRSAERLSSLLRENGGLYLKIGQAIAMQSAVLPPEFQRMFARMFDDAPQDGWEAVEKVIRDDFGGRSVEEVFGVSFAGVVEEGRGVMERTARASASVAQVHWARLADGREVAVKIQKPEIAKQIGWDLWAFKVVMKVYTWWFDLPLYSLVPFITERLMLETDFENEAKNSEVMRQLVHNEPSLRGRVYVPPVYPELSSKRVLTTEWIEGIRLWDKEALTQPWLGGYGKGSMGVHGAKLDPPDMEAIRRELRENPHSQNLKPERTEWRGRRGKGGLGVSTKEVMTTMIDLFSAQIFKWGVVHCDPHPGNIFIRRLPNGLPELVLIDHGLYVYMSDKFRHEYGVFWKALMTFDNKKITEITQEWGIKAADLFASATLLRPYEGGDQQLQKGMLGALDDSRTASQKHYEMQRRMKQGIRDVLADEDKWPKELIFIGRNMRIVQGNNAYMGSPVNRIKMMGEWASRSLFQDRNLPLRQRAVNIWQHLLFKAVLFLSDVAFYFFRLKQLLGRGGGLEDEVEARLKSVAKEFGVELQHDVFEG